MALRAGRWLNRRSASRLRIVGLPIRLSETCQHLNKAQGEDGCSLQVPPVLYNGGMFGSSTDEHNITLAQGP